jgi:hypothetical protein
MTEPGLITRVLVLAVGISEITAVYQVIKPDEVFFHLVLRKLHGFKHDRGVASRRQVCGISLQV